MTTATTRTRARRLLLCLLLALPTGLHAQLGEPRSALKYGFGAGLAMNSVGFTPSIKQKLHLGPTIGIVGRLYSEMYFKTLCSLLAELNQTQLGWREEILAHLAWGREAHGLAGFLNLGPQVGVLLGEGTSQSAQWTLNAEGNPDRPNNRFAQYTMDVEHRIDYGIMAGAGIEWHTRAGHFALEGRYYYGLADIYGNSKKDVFARSNHSTVSIRLSYLMGK